MKHIQERSDDFGLNLAGIHAFSKRGIWDEDQSEHLNIHSFHQIITARDGMLLLEDGFEKQPLYRGMAALIPVGKPHIIKVLRQNQKVICHSLFLRPELFRTTTDNICVYEISDLGTALLKELNKENLKDLSESIMGHCLKLFIEILSMDIHKPAHLIRLPEAKEARNKTVIGFIQDNYMNKIRLDHFARIIPLSVRQITRSFQDELHMSIIEYLRLYRLLQASVFLHEANKKIIDIAFDCGYDAVSSFHEDFRHIFGLSPNRFRKTIIH